MFYFDEEHDGWTSDSKSWLGFHLDILAMIISVAIPFWIGGIFDGADKFGLEMHTKRKNKTKKHKQKTSLEETDT